MKKINSLDEFRTESSEPTLGELLNEPTKSTGPRVNNSFPAIKPTTYRIAIIGEAPGQDEENQGRAFVGQSGRYLDQVLSKLGIIRACCFVGNVCQFRPFKNDISNFDLEGREITEGVARLNDDIAQFKPNICLLLGKTALWWANEQKNISAWRGSVFMSRHGIKCIATYHPAAALRQYELTPIIQWDVHKCLRESLTPEINEPKRDIQINLSYEDLIARLDHILVTKPAVSCDIEGGVACMSCIGLAISPTIAFVIPFATLNGGRYYQPEQEIIIWNKLSKILGSNDIHKVWQNGLYDRFVLQWSHSIVVRGNQDDTMLKFWEAYCELEKSLGFMSSILTDEPYYKFERKSEDQDTFYRYCGKDACVTFEINEKLNKRLDLSQVTHYKFNHSLLNLLLYMELRGLRYNEPLAKTRLEDVQSHIYNQQQQLDTIAAGMGAIKPMDYDNGPRHVLHQLQTIICYKRNPEQPKKSFIDVYFPIRERLLLAESTGESLTSEDKAKIAVVCSLTMNIRSPIFKDFLYSKEYCNLPTQWKKDLKTKEMKPTTDYEALLKLTKSHSHPVLGVSIYLSQLRTRAQSLDIPSWNGRMHWSVNLVGSETGRITTSKSMLYVSAKKRVGGNMQAVADDWDIEDKESPLAQGMRDLYVADEGCYLGKCDLKGADGWTVGAYMQMLGDPTMLDDLKYGLKPAQIVAYILKHGASRIQENFNNRTRLKELCSEIKKDDWEYFVSKQLIWGSCYLLGPRKGAELVFVQSEGKVNLSEKEVKDFQAAIFLRYRVQLWHEWMKRHLGSQSYPAKLVAPNGSTRKFFGRRDEILGEALAHLPQTVTTYAIKKAAYRLWTDPENTTEAEMDNGRMGKQRLRIEPMHTVHDELLCQFKINDTTWAIDKLKQWFDNEIEVAGQKITIPFDGAYGTAWSMDENHKIGEIK